MEGRVCVLIGLALVGLRASKAQVYIPDPNLKLAIERSLGITGPEPQDMLALTCLSAPHMGIKDLTGLEFAVNLSAIYLSWNQITDISPLAGLTSLEDLDINNNPCSDIGPLSGLVGLRYLNIHMCQVNDLTPLAQLQRLERLIARLNLVTDVGPLAGLSNLVELDLRDNLISDIGPLAGLSNLTELCLSNNQISDIGPIGGLERLKTLWLSKNLISDVGPLAGLGRLQYLYLAYNQITDISPLVGLKGPKTLDLQSNPLDTDAYKVYIPIIIQNNPGIRCWYDPWLTKTLSIYSTAGGSVVQPGQGSFEYAHGALVCLQALPQPGFEFSGWTGTFNSPSSSVFITMDQDHQVRACFVSLSNTIYVDDDAGNMMLADGTDLYPFHSVQQAIEVARQGATIVVRPGIYRGQIDLGARVVQITGIDPLVGPPSSYPVIEIYGTGPAFSLTGSPQATVEGLVISGVSGRSKAVIDCASSCLTMANCLVVGNRCLDPKGAILLACNSDIDLTRSTIIDNICGRAAILAECSRIRISESIIAANDPVQVLADMASSVLVHRSYIPGFLAGRAMEDLIDIQQTDLFVRRGYWADPCDPAKTITPTNPDAIWVHGDYHLLDNTWGIGAYSWP